MWWPGLVIAALAPLAAVCIQFAERRALGPVPRLPLLPDEVRS